MSQRNKYAATNANKQGQGSGAGMEALPKRSIYIGGTLALYYLFTWWMPLQFYSSTTNYCYYRCENYAMVTSSAFTITLLVNGEEMTVAASVAGCYESTDPECMPLCKQTCDVCESSVATCEIYEEELYAAYYGVDKDERGTALLLMIIGTAISFAAVLIGYISILKCKEAGSKLIAGALGISALLVIIGCILYVVQWNDDPAIDFEDMFNATQCLVFIERVWPSVVAITLAVDWYNNALNDEDKRMKAWIVPLFVSSISAAICMTIIINFEPDGADYYGYEYPEGIYSSGACIAAGYYIMALMACARILVWGGYIDMNTEKNKFGIALVLVIGAVITACGYWAWITALWDCDTLVDLDGTTYTECEGASQMAYVHVDAAAMIQLAEGEGVPWEGKSKAYYVGYTFFVLFMAAINAYDMNIVGNYKSVKG